MADGSTYLIDIAARMQGADATTAELIQLEKELLGAGTASDSLVTALRQARAQLASADTTASAAAEALKAGEQGYAQLERSAVNAAKALERAQLRGKVDSALERNAHAAAAALGAEAAALDRLRAAAKAAAAEQSRLQGVVKGLGDAERKAALGAAEVSGGIDVEALDRGGKLLGKLTGKAGLGGLADGLGGMAGDLGALSGIAGPIGIAAAAAVALGTAALTVAKATAQAVVETVRWGVALADAARSQRLATEALAVHVPALAGLAAELPPLTRATGLSADELRGLGKELAAAGVAAEDMPAALRAVATAEAALGKGAGAEFVKRMGAGKEAVGQVAREVEAKFGGIVAKRLLSLDSQSEELKRSLGETFGGLRIDGLLEQLNRLVKLFDVNTAMGRTLKATFEGLAQPLIDGLEAAGPVLEAFALGAAIGVLKLYIAFKPAIRAVRELFGSSDTTLEEALNAAEIAGKAAAAAVGVVALGVLSVAAHAATLWAGFTALKSAGETAWTAITDAIADALSWLKGISLAQIGKDMLDGLAKGITGAADVVLNALRGVVTDAIAAAKSLLGIKSPSRVFAGIGENTAEGFAQGVEEGQGEAQTALERLVAPPSGERAGRAQSPVGAGGRTSTLDLSGATFVFQGVAGAEDAEERFGALLTRLLEGDVAQLGGAEAAS